MPENARCTTCKTRNGGKGLLLVYYIRRVPRTTSARMYACMINPPPPCLLLSHVPHPTRSAEYCASSPGPFPPLPYYNKPYKMYGVRTHNTRSYARCIQDRWEGSMCEPISTTYNAEGAFLSSPRGFESPPLLSAVSFSESASLDLDEDPRVCGGRTGRKRERGQTERSQTRTFAVFAQFAKEKKREKKGRNGKAAKDDLSSIASRSLQLSIFLVPPEDPHSKGRKNGFLCNISVA